MFNIARNLLVLLATVGWAFPVGAQDAFTGPTGSPFDGGGIMAPPGMAAPGAPYPGGMAPPGPPELPRLPPDMLGPQRFQMPTPAQGFGYAGVPNTNWNTRPNLRGPGVRLDTSYYFVREIEYGSFLSEHIWANQFGVTVLPFQSPNFIVGLRVMGGHHDNLSIAAASPAVDMDLYFATRYNSTFFKIGYFIDSQEDYGKQGVSGGILSDVPLLGNMTFEGAFAYGFGSDRVGRDFNLVTRRFQLTEVADLDMQIRIGKFLTPEIQAGITGNYLTYNKHEEEWGAGLFCNVTMGFVNVGVDLTGGREGLRGFLTLGYSWGSGPAEHPRDLYLPVDTVAWSTRAPRRDLALRIRETFNGPLLLQSR